jgi:hypothetical protein
VSHQLVIIGQNEIIDVELLAPNVDQTYFGEVELVVRLSNDNFLDALISKMSFKGFPFDSWADSSRTTGFQQSNVAPAAATGCWLLL